MTIFKTTLRIVRAHLAAFIVYLALPVLMTALFIGTGQSTSEVYKTKAIDFVVFDHDESPVSKGLIAYLETDNHRRFLAEDRDTVRDALFYMQTDYVLEIPAGFGASLLSDGEALSLGRQIAPDTMAPSALDTRIKRYLAFVENHRAIDPTQSAEAIVAKAAESVAHTGTVQLETVGQDAAMQTLPSIFRFLAYTLLNLCLLVVSQVLMSFRQKPILERSLVSATPSTVLNRRLITSILIVSAVTFFLNLLPILVFTGIRLFSVAGLLLLFNAACFALVAISIGFLGSGLFRQESGLSSAMQTVIPLVLSFFSGIFVPLEYIPAGIQKVASFFPTYWYNMSLISMEEAVLPTAELTATFLRNGLIQLAFAAAFFIIYVAVEYHRQRRHIVVAAAKA